MSSAVDRYHDESDDVTPSPPPMGGWTGKSRIRSSARLTKSAMYEGGRGSPVRRSSLRPWPIRPPRPPRRVPAPSGSSPRPTRSRRGGGSRAPHATAGWDAASDAGAAVARGDGAEVDEATSPRPTRWWERYNGWHAPTRRGAMPGRDGASPRLPALASSAIVVDF